MSYAEGVLLAVQDYEDKQFEREMLEKKLAAQAKQDVLPFALEALKMQRALVQQETEAKRLASSLGFKKEVRDALWDAGQLIEMTELASKTNTDKQFVVGLNETIIKQIGKRKIAEEPERVVASVAAALTSSDKIETREEEKYAISLAKLYSSETTAEDLRDMLPELVTQGTREYTQPTFDIRRGAAESIEDTDTSRIKKEMLKSLQSSMKDFIEARDTAYGTEYIYSKAAPGSIDRLFEGMTQAVKELNRSQDIGDVDKTDIRNAIINQVSDAISSVGPEGRAAVIDNMANYFSNEMPSSLEFDFPTVTIPKTEPKTGGGETDVLTSDDASQSIGGAGIDDIINQSYIGAGQ